MIQVNLLPDVKQELLSAQRQRSVVISVAILASMIAAAVVVVLAITVFGGQALLNWRADQDITSETKKLKSVPDLSKTLTLQNQLVQLQSQYNNKTIDSRLFAFINAVVPPSPNDVKISSINLDATNTTISLDGQAANGYAALEIFKKTINAAEIRYKDDSGQTQTTAITSDLADSNVSYGEDSSGAKVLRFTLTFTYAPELFAATSQNAQILISTTGNVTDSYLGIPQTIFQTKASDIKGDK